MKLLIIKTKEDNRFIHKLLSKSYDDLTEQGSDLEFEGYQLMDDEAVFVVLDNLDKFKLSLGKQKIPNWML